MALNLVVDFWPETLGFPTTLYRRLSVYSLVRIQTKNYTNDYGSPQYHVCEAHELSAEKHTPGHPKNAEGFFTSSKR
jgi:hypothetical protein